MGVKRITIRDVAKEAGVSIATVSNALNGIEVVKPDTKRRIEAAAERLHYIPNVMGKQLKSGKTKMIGIYTNRISGPYFTGLIDGIVSGLKTKGYGVNIIVSENHEVVVNSILGNVVDGAIVFEEALDKKDIETIKAKEISTVFVNKIVYGKKVGSIVFDSFAKGHLAGDYLLNLGHRKIGYVKGQKGIYDEEERFHGFATAMSKKGLEYQEKYTIVGNFVEPDAYRNTLNYLEKHPDDLPTALLAANDESAIGVIKALKEKQIRVPEDISVMGFDDIDLLQYFEPKLTTIRNSSREQGEMAAQMLLGIMNNQREGSVKEVIGTLKIRETTKEV